MRNYLHEARILIALVVPIICSQGAQTAIGVIDTMMAGAVSAKDLAAVAIGTSIWLPTILFCNGVLLALTPIIAQLNGAQQNHKIAHPIQQGFWLATLLAIGTMIFLYYAHSILQLISDDHELVTIATGYLHTILWGAPGFLYFQVLRNQCEGLSHTKPGMVISFIALIVNLPINYILIHGKFGLPAFGGVGCGIASAIVYWLMFLLIRVYTKRSKNYKIINESSHFEKPKWETMNKIVKLGLPIALAVFSEVSLFAVVAILITPLGAILVSAHQITLNFSSLLFVLPMSMGTAATIRIGYLIGKSSFNEVKIASYTALIIGFLVAIIMANLSIYFREEIAKLYIDDKQVITIASHLMILAAAYQCSDAIQVIGTGILRGYKDTRIIFVITLISYWLLGLPVGYLLGLTNIIVPAMGPAGFWIGFIVGLTCSAVLVSLRIRYLQKLPLKQILVRMHY